MKQANIIDKSIPYKNLLMRCDAFFEREIILPEGYLFRGYLPGDDIEWARLEIAVNDFDTIENAIGYFKDKYKSNIKDLERGFICIQAADGHVAGIVIAWRDESDGDMVSTVHWLVTSPADQGLGIGKALICKLLERFYEFNAFPVYLHTQPWSYTAIGLYSSVGFKMLKTESIMNYKNEYTEALPILKELMSAAKYQKLLEESI